MLKKAKNILDKKYLHIQELYNNFDTPSVFCYKNRSSKVRVLDIKPTEY